MKLGLAGFMAGPDIESAGSADTMALYFSLPGEGKHAKRLTKTIQFGLWTNKRSCLHSIHIVSPVYLHLHPVCS